MSSKKSIINVLKAAAPKWEFKQINFVVDKRGSVVESDFYTKLKKLHVQEGKQNKLFAELHVQEGKKRQALRRSCDKGMRSTQLGDGIFPPSGARRCEANHSGIKGEHRAQCARVRRYREEHTLIGCQTCESGLRMVTWESQSKTSPQSPEDGHIYCI